jgi:hypothetical protein
MESIFEIAFGLAFLLLNLNLIIAVLSKRIFLFGRNYKINKNMSIFQLKMEYGKSYSLGHWFQKGESGYTTAVIGNIVIYCGFLFVLL